MVTAFQAKSRKPCFERCMGFFFCFIWGLKDVSCCWCSFKMFSPAARNSSKKLDLGSFLRIQLQSLVLLLSCWMTVNP